MAYARDDHDRVARHTQTAEALRDAHARLRDEVMPKVATVMGSVVNNPLLLPWRGALVRVSTQVDEQLSQLERALASLLAPVLLPIRLWDAADGWTQVRAQASGVVGDLQVTNREVHIRWQGAARDAYDTVIPAQVAAANRLAAVADGLQFALSWVGFTAAAFYTALLAVILQAIAGIIVAVVTAASVAGAVAGTVLLGMIVAAVLVQTALLIVATVEAVGRVRIWMIDMLGEVRDASAFPNGQWPRSRTEWFSDATVTDGDADWSVVR